ncbi:hypothetical protein [Ralstonia chuxiongensis]|uniref:Transmembrane protein n=1 Tax=Ralstonia chuxiongensis TaxID=2957504 RepID=A0AA42BL06_9RALS|nr:hypothetical protein [Ralstonia chuxiongensis]MCP1175663.1 hypothetical protein [Ralstonia chuxiongensis]
MDVQSQDRTHECARTAGVRAAGEGCRDISNEELLREWKAEHTAFGLVLVAYAFLMGLAPLIARYPAEMNQMFCALLQPTVSWGAWVVAATVLCLVSILLIARKRRPKTASGA